MKRSKTWKSDALRANAVRALCWANEPGTFRRCVYEEHHDGEHSWQVQDAAPPSADELQKVALR